MIAPSAAKGALGIASSLLEDQWTKPLHYVFFGGYTLFLIILFILLVLLSVWLSQHRAPTRQEILTGLFVASLLNIPCDFALIDALSQVVVLDAERSQAFVFAVGIASLDFPLLLHGLIALLVVVSWKRWGSRPPGASPPEPATRT